MKSVGIIGGLGRLGRAIVAEMEKDGSLQLHCIVDAAKEHLKKDTLGDLGFAHFSKVPIFSMLEEIGSAPSVFIDASSADAVIGHLSWCAEKKVPYILAVTGLGKTVDDSIEAAMARIPILIAPNLSLGVAVLNELAKTAAQCLPTTDVEIVETHHRFKKDAPSGTAMALAGLIASVSSHRQEVSLGRPAEGVRHPDSIVLHAVRGGDVVGEHRVSFFEEGERIELAHIATDRKIFAKGALTAARFLAEAEPGAYTMRDVLFPGRNSHGS